MPDLEIKIEPEHLHEATIAAFQCICTGTPIDIENIFIYVDGSGGKADRENIWDPAWAVAIICESTLGQFTLHGIPS